MNFQVDRGLRVPNNNPRDEMTSSSSASSLSLHSPTEESGSSDEARRHPHATPYLCSVRFRSPRRFWDLVPLSVRQFLRNQSIGRDLVGMTLGITVGASTILYDTRHSYLSLKHEHSPDNLPDSSSSPWYLFRNPTPPSGPCPTSSYPATLSPRMGTRTKS